MGLGTRYSVMIFMLPCENTSAQALHFEKKDIPAQLK